MPLTDVAIKNAKFVDKQFKLSDSGGLYLLVTKSGKYFRLDYRYLKKRKTLALGVYPKISLANARKKRDQAKELLGEGIDPGIKRKQEKHLRKQAVQNNFEAVAREWFEKKKPKWAPGYARTVIGRLELNIFPYIGTIPVGEINAPLLLSVLRKMESREAHDTARRVRGLCSKVFQYAVATGKAERDPASDLKGALTEVTVTHMAAITEPAEIGALLRAIDGYEGAFQTKCAMKLAPLTFVRPGELRHAQWSEIDLDEALWKIPAKKMKMRGAHLVPLSRQAINVLREIEQLTGALEGAGYVFPSIRTTSRPMSENTVNAALRRLGYDKTEMTGHGFRAMASTNLHEQGWKSEVIERQLAHVEKNTVKAAYNHAEHLPERRKMMQYWADYLDGLKAGGKIIPIRKQA
ncbi:tyrosine-type recombinase/integrase [Desulfopila sp. IMCC35008]|uniref:tyrosine-type recombinase/integrase n=1 Tax=Desulfopila sp. IMCC35008 TaxID=2653858 RepID=UPI0013D774CA|nr:tyrosine-type recombinase/integrase [Desulfopila sp. IMCC35008]